MLNMPALFFPEFMLNMSAICSQNLCPIFWGLHAQFLGESMPNFFNTWLTPATIYGRRRRAWLTPATIYGRRRRAKVAATHFQQNSFSTEHIFN
jgi:hypothetical protein